MYNQSPVDDTLLKKLSIETQLVGKLVVVKGWAAEPDSQAVINNVIILPGALFYKSQFMNYYELFHKNAVKALKELVKNYPDTNDFQLDTAYVVTIINNDEKTLSSSIKNRSEFMLAEDLAIQRQEIFKNGGRLTLKEKRKLYK